MDRWNCRDFLLGLGLTLILTVSVCTASGWEITQLTDNDYDDLSPDLSGMTLAWCANVAGSTPAGREIMLYDGATTTRVTTNGCEDITPRVTSDGICWQGKADGADWEIFYHNAAGTILLTDNTYNDLSPKTLDGRVVWYGNGGTKATGEIYLYNGFSVTPLTTNNYPDMQPAISSDRIAWAGRCNNHWEIFVQEESVTRQLTDNDVDDTSPCFGDGVLFWRSEVLTDENGYLGRITMYDGATPVTFTNDENMNDQAPVANGRRAVWRSLDVVQNTYSIFLYRGTEILCLMSNEFISDPVISENLVVWSARVGEDYEIFVYDGVETTQLTDNDYEDQFPSVSGRNITWVGYCGPKAGENLTGEIFLATHLPEPGSAILLLFGIGWLTRRGAARTIRRSYDNTHCRNG